MGQAHLMGMRERAQVVRSTMRRLGASVTQEEVNAELERIGQPGVSRKCFERNWGRVFKPQLDRPEPESPGPSLLTEGDARLAAFVRGHFAADPSAGEAFVRFYFAVEAAGGVAKAREYLGLVERCCKGGTT